MKNTIMANQAKTWMSLSQLSDSRNKIERMPFRDIERWNGSYKWNCKELDMGSEEDTSKAKTHTSGVGDVLDRTQNIRSIFNL